MSGSYGRYIGEMETRNDGMFNVEIQADACGIYLLEHNRETGRTKRIYIPGWRLNRFMEMVAEASASCAEQQMDALDEGRD